MWLESRIIIGIPGVAIWLLIIYVYFLKTPGPTSIHLCGQSVRFSAKSGQQLASNKVSTSMLRRENWTL